MVERPRASTSPSNDSARARRNAVAPVERVARRADGAGRGAPDAELELARGLAGIAGEGQAALDVRQALRRRRGAGETRIAVDPAPGVERRARTGCAAPAAAARPRASSPQRRRAHRRGPADAAACGRSTRDREARDRPFEHAAAEPQLARRDGEPAAKAVGEVAAPGERQRDLARRRPRARSRRPSRRSAGRAGGTARPIGGGSSRSTWPSLSRPSSIRPAMRTPRAVIRPTRGPGEAEQDPDLDPARGEIRAARIADHQILEDLAAEADPLDVVARGDAAPRQLAVDIAGRELDPHRPERSRRRGASRPSRTASAIRSHRGSQRRLTLIASPSTCRRTHPPRRRSTALRLRNRMSRA